MNLEWLGKGYKKQFESLDITQEGLDELRVIYTRLHNPDKETRDVYSLVYREKYQKGKKAVDWNIGSLRYYFSHYRVNNAENFLRFISQQPKHTKRQIFYLVKEIFKKKQK